MTKIITTRVDHETAERIQQASKKAKTDKATFLRIIITKGLDNVEEEDVLERYQKGEISIGKLSELLHITYWDALDLLKERHIHFNYGEEQLKEDLKALKNK